MAGSDAGWLRWVVVGLAYAISGLALALAGSSLCAHMV